jgi:integrase
MFCRVQEAFSTVRSMPDSESPQSNWEKVARALEEEVRLSEEVRRGDARLAHLKAETAERRMLLDTLANELKMKDILERPSWDLTEVQAFIDKVASNPELTAKVAKIGNANDVIVAMRAMMQDSLHTSGVPVRSLPTPTVTSFLKDTYAEEKKLHASQGRHVRNYVTLFARITGDKALNEYVRADVLKWASTLEKFKSSLGKSDKDAHKTIKQLLAESKGHVTMSRTTIEKHITHVKAFFRTSIKHYKFASGDDIDDLFDDIKFSDTVPRAKKRKSWSIDQLNALFATPTWRGTRSRSDDLSARHQAGSNIYRDAYWWLPLLALYTGCRLEELAQLHSTDLGRDQNGTPFLIIHQEGYRRLKTDSSERNVPVHSQLSTYLFFFATRVDVENRHVIQGFRHFCGV